MEYGAIGRRLAAAQRMLCVICHLFLSQHTLEKNLANANLIWSEYRSCRYGFFSWFFSKTFYSNSFLVFTLTQNMIRKIHGKNWRIHKKATTIKTNIQCEINQKMNKSNFNWNVSLLCFFFGKWKFIVKLLQFPIYSSILLLLAHYNRSTHLVVVVFLRCSLSWLLLFFHLLFIMLSLSWLHRIIIY